MISLATSRGRYLPSADCAKWRCCGGDRARGGADRGEGHDPADSPAEHRQLLRVDARLPAPNRAGRISTASWPSRIGPSRHGRASIRLVIAPAATTRIAVAHSAQPAIDEYIAPSSSCASMWAWTSSPIIVPPSRPRGRRLELVEIEDVAADQHVAPLDLRSERLRRNIAGEQLDRQFREYRPLRIGRCAEADRALDNGGTRGAAGSGYWRAAAAGWPAARASCESHCRRGRTRTARSQASPRRRRSLSGSPAGTPPDCTRRNPDWSRPRRSARYVGVLIVLNAAISWSSSGVR